MAGVVLPKKSGVHPQPVAVRGGRCACSVAIERYLHAAHAEREQADAALTDVLDACGLHGVH